MRMVHEGRLITINKFGEILARKYEARIACTIKSGIFAWISANYAEETKK